ncbi:site-specific integrase [Xanthomonas campestris]|uniref:site-specific integrase n=1 Tax=Xanthomonas campestris TaxID=339 RepID=UPI002379E7C3|nr:site-specific integrase [Xanthomonas campestris]WDK32715.1 site-specific integrase [Xanthomonas campestris]
MPNIWQTPISSTPDSKPGRYSGRGDVADPKNISTTEHSLKLLLGVIGDKAIGEIEQDDISTFRNALRWWPPNATRKREFEGLSICEIIQKGKANNLPEPSGNTINNHMAKVNKFFNSLVAKRKLAHSPMQGIELRIRNSGPIEERLFDPCDLKAIFKEEDYMAWVNGKPHLYWTPLIAYCTGARINEIAQLKLADITEIDGQLCFLIRVTKDIDEHGAKIKTSNQKIKGKPSSRVIPVSSILMEQGFQTYIEDIRKTGHPRLFPFLSAGVSLVNGRRKVLGYGYSLTPQFSAYLKTKGFEKGVAFHAFRHTFATMLHQEGVDIENIEQITGHLPSFHSRQVSAATLKSHYLHLGTKTAEVESMVRTISALRPLPEIPAYKSDLFQAALSQKRKFHP